MILDLIFLLLFLTFVWLVFIKVTKVGKYQIKAKQYESLLKIGIIKKYAKEKGYDLDYIQMLEDSKETTSKEFTKELESKIIEELNKKYDLNN